MIDLSDKIAAYANALDSDIDAERFQQVRNRALWRGWIGTIYGAGVGTEAGYAFCTKNDALQALADEAEALYAQVQQPGESPAVAVEPAPDRRRLFPDPPKGAGKAAAMYRNPETGESWSGRGLKPRWMVAAQEAGRTMEDFLITA